MLIMRLNPDLLLGEITTKYGGTSYSSAKVSLAYDCIFIAQEWFDKTSSKHLKKSLKRYVRDRVRLSRYRGKHGFIPSFIWWFIARAVISWIVDRIIKLYF